MASQKLVLGAVALAAATAALRMFRRRKSQRAKQAMQMGETAGSGAGQVSESASELQQSDTQAALEEVTSLPIE